jgi:hypothetical protein
MKTRSVKLFLMALALLSMGYLASCDKDDDAEPVVKTDLQAGIVSASLLISTTTEGVGTGNYLRGSQAPLIAAIAAAQAVADDATATQEEVTSATVALAAALTTYSTLIVVPIDPANLVAQWTFDEIGTAAVGANVKDYSGNAHNGSMKTGHEFWGGGVPTLAADRYGVAGKAVHFNEGGNVEVPYATGLNPPVISISLWAKPDVNSPIINNQYFLSMNRWNGWKFNFQDFPRAFFTATYDNAAANPPVTNVCCYDRDQNAGSAPQGEWHHYVLTFGGGHEVFYIDGTLIYDWGAVPAEGVPGTISLLANPVNLVIGQDLPTSGYSLDDTQPNYLNWGGFYIGILDEVRIYKSILTASQVTSIYEVEKP